MIYRVRGGWCVRRRVTAHGQTRVRVGRGHGAVMGAVHHGHDHGRAWDWELELAWDVQVCTSGSGRHGMP